MLVNFAILKARPQSCSYKFAVEPGIRHLRAETTTIALPVTVWTRLMTVFLSLRLLCH